MTLYELSGQYAVLIAAYENAESEEEAENALLALDEVSENITEKAEAYSRIMRNAQANADSIASEIKRLQYIKKQNEHLVERMKNGMLEAMTVIGTSKVETSIGKWSVQRNPYSVEILDESQIPDEFWIPQPATIDKKQLLVRFKETGEIIPGADFVQNMGVRFR